MAIFARLTEADDNGDRAVIETVEAADAADLSSRFHPLIAGTFISVPAATLPGSIKNGQTWTHPELVDPGDLGEPARRLIVSRTEYYGLFTPPEEAMIRIMAKSEITIEMLAAADPAGKQQLMAIASLQVMLSRTDALASSDTIDLTNHQVQQGLGLLVALALLTTARRDEILLGVDA